MAYGIVYSEDERIIVDKAVVDAEYLEVWYNDGDYRVLRVFS